MIKNVLQRNIGTIGVGAAGALAGAGLGYLAGRRNSNKKTRKKRRSSAKNKRKRGSSFRSKKGRARKTPYTAGKRKDTSRRRIRYTKNGQPYILLSSGKARFLKKSSVRNRRKRAGGSY